MSRPRYLSRLEASLAGGLVDTTWRTSACEDEANHGRPWHCCHALQHLRLVNHSDGTQHVKWVCDTCGWASQAVAQSTVAPDVLDGLQPADPEVRPCWEAMQQEMVRSAYTAVEREESMTDRQKRYAEFTRSPEWMRLRNRRLQLDGYICQDCGGSATRVHHVFYPEEEYWAETPLWTLISLCDACHTKAHRIYKPGTVPWGSHVDR